MPHRTKYAPVCDGSADPDLWFRPDAQSIADAKRACNRCELRAQCLEYAMTYADEDQHGVWGAMSAADRKALRRQNPDRHPARVGNVESYIGGRKATYGRNVTGEYGERYVEWGKTEMKRPAVDWSAVESSELDDRVLSLMERYQDVTEHGYGLTAGSVMVTPANANEVAA